jgi:cell wall-associated NlpC family hydrolase
MLTAVIATTPVAPLFADASLRSEQLSQIAFGRVANVVAAQGEWRRVRTRLDQYEGWVHLGYAREVPFEEADAWEATATGWSEGMVAEVRERMIRIPLGGRVLVEAGGVFVMPGGRKGKLLSGRVVSADALAKENRAMPVEKWAAKFFGGTGYLWGGVTPLGVDCSGLVQVTFAARGVQLPRDSFMQAEVGEPVTLETSKPGDLLFFSENGRSVTHVAMVGPGDSLIHSSLSGGGFAQEPWGPGTRAAYLHDFLVGGRRPPRGEGPAL